MLTVVSPPPAPLLYPATKRECEVSLSEEMKDGKQWVFGDPFFGDMVSAVLFSPPVLAPSLAFSLCLAPPALPLILSEMVCASRNLHNTLLTPLL